MGYLYMGGDILLILVTLSEQFIVAVILAAILLYFYRIYRRSYLLSWSLSFCGSALYFLFSSFAYSFALAMNPVHPFRLIISPISLFGAYFQIAMLLVGTYQLISEKAVSKRFLTWVCISVIAAAIITSLIGLADPTAGGIRYFWRFAFKYLLAGIGFLFAAFIVLETKRLDHGIGKNMVGIIFLLIGAEQLFHFVSSIFDILNVEFLALATNYLRLADLLLFLLLGVGLVIWLLEEERRKVLEAAEMRRLSEERFQDLIQSLNEIVWATDIEGTRIIYANRATAEIYGRPLDDIITDPAVRFRMIHPDDQKAFQEARMNLHVKGEYETEFRISRPDATTRWIHLREKIIAGKDGKREQIGGIGIDITERKRAELELSAAKERLERQLTEIKDLNKDLEAFDYSVSNALQVPLRHIEGFSDVLLEESGDSINERGKTYLKKIKAAVENAKMLISDLLMLSKASRGSLSRVRVNLSLIARSIAARLKQAEPQRNIEFIIPDDITAEGDDRLLTIVLDNLLGNAWKFTRANPAARIEFGVKREGGVSVYFVKDNGVGFDQEYAQKLFLPFERLHSPEYEGSGLGLATTQRIIHRHGGNLWAEGAENQGATFYFSFK